MSPAALTLPPPAPEAQAGLTAAYRVLRKGSDVLARAPNGQVLFGVSRHAVRAYVLARYWGADVRLAVAGALLGVGSLAELGPAGVAWVEGVTGFLQQLEGKR